MRRLKVCVLAGDGIGPEIIEEATKLIRSIAKKHKLELVLEEGLVGGTSIDAHGIPLTDEVLDMAFRSDAVLLGAVGGPKWDELDYAIRPERALLKLRKELALFANLRPAKMFKPLINSSTLKPEVIRDVDLVVVRELTGGLYFGTPKGIETLPDGTEKAVNSMVYTTAEIERIAVVAFEVAMMRRKKVVSVDKSNVLDVSVLWKKVVTAVAEEYPEVELSHMYVDNCAMQLVRNPAQFDVIVTENTFGDILSDEAAMLTGSIGMLPSASLGPIKNRAMYEPIHGSAPDIAGKGIANPIGTILSVAMMLKYSFDGHDVAKEVEDAVEAVLNNGLRTADIFEPGMTKVSCSEMGSAIVEEIERDKRPIKFI
ncbi:MAG: 3-isopropylmalate dehydrogenase [Deltaproteobacteria bacterium]|nr:3-isopropylmalate dehydrogenase [Deltaproteobacteria bacterium]